MLKLKTIIIYCFLYSLLIYTHFSHAASTLTTPKGLEVLLINGEKPAAHSPLKLIDGEQQVVFRYSVNYRQQGQRIRFNSNVIIVKFNAIDQQYTIKLPKINSKQSAQQFNKKAQLSIVNALDESITFAHDTLQKTGFQIGRNIVQEMEVYNQSSQIAAMDIYEGNAHSTHTITKAKNATLQAKFKNTQQPVSTHSSASNSLRSGPVASSVVIPAKSVTNKFKPKTIEEDQAEIIQMLNYWYSKANNDTKKKFKEKINNGLNR